MAHVCRDDHHATLVTEALGLGDENSIAAQRFVRRERLPADSRIGPDFGSTTRRTFHSLRKHYGTRLASEGVPLRTIQKMLGHSDISITARKYADVIPKRAAQQVRDAFDSSR